MSPSLHWRCGCGSSGFEVLGRGTLNLLFSVAILILCRTERRKNPRARVRLRYRQFRNETQLMSSSKKVTMYSVLEELVYSFKNKPQKVFVLCNRPQGSRRLCQLTMIPPG